MVVGATHTVSLQTDSTKLYRLSPIATWFILDFIAKIGKITRLLEI
jgi:hypothetical protein